MKCKCGKEATHIADLPMSNVFVGLKQATQEVPVCDYHAQKSRNLGYYVKKI